MSRWEGLRLREARLELSEGAEQACGVFNHNFSGARYTFLMFVAYLIIHPRATDPLN